ncbi:MAG: alginate export family protein [Kiritimatiellae bacterium]|nr:alginate export family protein [Kiritimatiellia bacterium]
MDSRRAEAIAAGFQMVRAPAALLALLALGMRAPADDAPAPVDLRASGSFRLRYEHLEGFNVSGYGGPDDDLLLGRARVRLDAASPLGPTAALELQSAYYWLSRLRLDDLGNATPHRDDLDVRIALLEWRQIADTPLGISVGRQDLTYGAGRLFAPMNWGNVGGNWWDAARLLWDEKSFNLHALYARRVRIEPRALNRHHAPFHLAGAIGHLHIDAVEPEVFYLLKRNESAPDETRHTAGASLYRRAGQGWDGLLWYAVQTGELDGRDIRAWALLLHGGHTFEAPGRPRLGFEYNRASGDPTPDDRHEGTFDGVYGQIAQPYGWMNFVMLKNLEEAVLTGSLQPSSSLTATLELHLFRLAEPRDAWYWSTRQPERRDPTGRAGADLGREIDFILGWKPGGGLEVLAGVARFWPGTYLRRTEGGARPANWWFLQLQWSW